ncbi:MAG: c-type cytochrome [Nitrospiria bacterium]
MTIVFVAMGVLFIGQSTVYAADIEAGKTFYAKKRCGMCHVLEGKGGKIASDLSGIGSRRDEAWLLKFFKNPKKTAGAKMMPVKGTEAELANLAAYLASQK